MGLRGPRVPRCVHVPVCCHRDLPWCTPAAGHADIALPTPPPRVACRHAVMFLRLVTSCEVQRREDHFFPFILVRGRGMTKVPASG